MVMKAALYVRLSREDVNKAGDVDSESIKNQKNLLMEYVSEKGWQIFDIYCDEDYRGSDRERPEFNRLVSDSYLKKFDVVVCKEQSRFARDLEYIEKYIHGSFVDNRVRFIAILDHIDTGDGSTKLSSHLNGLTDSMYLEKLSSNVTATFNVKRKNGEYIGSWPLYGYAKDPENKNHLVVDSDAAEIVREIYNMYLSGNGLHRIATTLNDAGIPNPMLYKKQAGMKIGAPGRETSKTYLWRGSAVGNMLDNRMYIGDMVQGCMKKASYKSKKLFRVPKEDWIIKEGTHEPIIDLCIWEAVRAMRSGKNRSRRDGLYNIFLGKIRCLECGELMHSASYPKIVEGVKSKTEFYNMFRCSKKLIQTKACDSNGMAELSLERYVLQELNKLAHDYFHGNEIKEQVQITDPREERQNFLEKRIRDAEKAIADANKVFTSLYMDKVANVINEKQFIQINGKVTEDNEKAEATICKLQKELESLKNMGIKKQSMEELIGKYRELDKLNREVVQELIDVIYIGKKVDKKRTIKIVWNF